MNTNRTELTKGTNVNTELDPAIAGLGEPEAPLPSWDEAVAHAETLRGQGVDVSIDEHLKWILIRGTNGKYHDPADGTPAFQWFYPDGTPMTIEHYTNGDIHDPADGTPAIQEFHPDGTPKWISHWTNGKLVGEESFPPPTGADRLETGDIMFGARP